MQKRVMWTKTGLSDLRNRFDLGSEAEQVRLKVEEKINLGDFQEWQAPRKDNRFTIAISGMRFVCVKDRGDYRIISVLTQRQLERVVGKWAKTGQAGAVTERGKHLRSMPFAGLRDALG